MKEEDTIEFRIWDTVLNWNDLSAWMYRDLNSTHPSYSHLRAYYQFTHPWEIGRFITPYGNGLSLGNGFTWAYDITDYAPFLHDSVQLKAGNFQELLDMKFLMIEGTPQRNVKKIEKVYSGSYSLNNLKRYSRTNPTATAPMVMLQNLGGDTLKSADIVYSPANAATKTFHWTGNLPMMGYRTSATGIVQPRRVGNRKRTV